MSSANSGFIRSLLFLILAYLKDDVRVTSSLLYRDALHLSDALYLFLEVIGVIQCLKIALL